MASLRRENGVYILDFRFRGRRVKRQVGTSRREAEQIVRDVNRRIARDALGLPAEDWPVEDALVEFISDRRSRNTARYVDYQEKVLRQFIAFAKVSQMRHIQSGDILRWQRRRLLETSTTTARKSVKKLRTFLRWCKRRGYLYEDPSSSVELLPRPPRREIRFMAKKEADRLLEACKAPCPRRGPGRKGNGTTRPRKTPLY